MPQHISNAVSRPCVCKAFTLYVCPSSLVLVNPCVLATNNRYPYTSTSPAAATSVIPNTYTKVSRILVSVYNVNGNKKSYVY